MVTSDTAVANLKIPPHSVEAEQSVLGGLLIDNLSWDKIVDKINIDDFYRQEHKLIYKSMSELAMQNQPFDPITITEQLKLTDRLDQAGGEAYLYELSQNTPTAANIQAYADIVRERSVLRQLIHVAQGITQVAFKPDGRASADLLDEAEQRVFKIAEKHARGSGPIVIGDLLAKTVERIDHIYQSKSAITGIPTGFKDFDELTSGLQPADLVIIAGRPSMGKTVLGMNFAEHAALEIKKPVLIFSLEMPSDSIAMRMLSSLGRVDQHAIRTGKLSDEDWARISSGVSLLSDAPIFIDDTPGLGPVELRARARRLVREQGDLAMIVVDYIQLMHIPGFREGRTAEISDISRGLKSLAKELNVPVIGLSQLNRSLEQRADRRPIMSDLRESGAIEQDADIIAFIYRDEVYNEDTRDKGIAEIIIAKQRNGPIGTVRLAFLGKYMRFDTLASPVYAQGSMQ